MAGQQKLELLAVGCQSLEPFLGRNLPFVCAMLVDTVLSIQSAIRALGSHAVAFDLPSSTTKARRGDMLPPAFDSIRGRTGFRRHQRRRTLVSSFWCWCWRCRCSRRVMVLGTAGSKY